jgi:hypothetical protein
MDEVIKQAPSDIAVEDIEVIFKKNNENVLDTLFDLWNIEVKDAKAAKSAKSAKSAKKDDDETEAVDEDDAELDFTNPETKWENIRNICDAYDIEMQAHLNRLKGK